jgi:hypothetical protein
MNEPQVINIDTKATEISLSSETPLKLNTNPQTNTSIPESNKAINFGPGIELFMNEKKKDSGRSTPTSDVNLDELNKLESELNNLSDTEKKSKAEARNTVFSQIPTVKFSENITTDSTKTISGDKPFSDNSTKDFIKLNNQSNTTSIGGNTSGSDNSNIGQSTANSTQSKTTWDGFKKFNEIPVNPDKVIDTKPQMTTEELLMEKFKYMRKLEELEKKGVTISKKYGMDSSLAEMQGEYELIMSEKERSNSVKFQGKMLMACITGLEFLNNKVDPFDLKLDGWAEQTNENINDYDEIFTELHEKYKSKAKMAPELKLLFQIGGGAVMLHMTNSMFKTAMPGLDDIMRQNPDLMSHFTQAAVDSMGKTNPGFGGFMNNMMNPEQSGADGGGGGGMGGMGGMGGGMGGMGGMGGASSSNGGPPAPLATKPMNSAVNSQRDREATPRTPGVNMSQSQNDGINIQETFSNAGGVEKSMRRPRAEMQGPKDISDILSNIKTKKVDIKSTSNDDNKSTISIADLKEMQATTRQMPKRSGRRSHSEKNVIQLDI